MQDKILSMIGMANKAGKVQTGEFLCEAAVKEQKAKLVIVAEDASNNTQKLFLDKCKYYNIPVYIYSTKEYLGKWTGKEFRASVAIMDKGFADAIEKNLKTDLHFEK